MLLMVRTERSLGGSCKRMFKRRRSDSNRCIKVLQTSPLPLGYGAVRITFLLYLQFSRGSRRLRAFYNDIQADCFLAGWSVRFHEVGRFLCRLQSGNVLPAGTNN